MIPIRLTLLLIAVAVLLLAVLQNPEPITFHFLFWSQQFELYKVIIAAAVFGAVMALLYTSQARYLQRIRSRWK